MKHVQISPDQYVSISPQAQERARVAFARVGYTKIQADQIAQASDVVTQITVLAGSRKKLLALANDRALAA
jgi:hypothetical protein